MLRRFPRRPIAKRMLPTTPSVSAATFAASNRLAPLFSVRPIIDSVKPRPASSALLPPPPCVAFSTTSGVAVAAPLMVRVRASDGEDSFGAVSVTFPVCVVSIPSLLMVDDCRDVAELVTVPVKVNVLEISSVPLAVTDATLGLSGSA